MDLKKSFILRHWEIVLVLGIVVYFVKRLFENKRGNEDERIIEKDTVNEDGGEDVDLTPSLENIQHIRFTGAKVMLKGGAEEFFNMVNDRRSIRKFSKKPVDIDVVEKCIESAGTAPSGAHTQPWTFCLIKSDDIKSKIRELIENEEYTNYAQRMSKQWTTDLKPFKTNHIKKYLTDAPYIILVFKQIYGLRTNGAKKVHYYNEVSCAISVGILLCALQSAGLSSLTTTPLNCGPALRVLLSRPQNEKLMVVLPVGYSGQDCEIPDLHRKPLKDILEVY